MLKPVIQLAVIGIVGIGLWKVAAFFLLPLFFLILKVAFIAGLIAVAFWFFNKRGPKTDTPPPVSE